jgi:peptide/nickel transport system substrate-binding protein
VKWSWERFLALQPRRTLFSNALSPDAPVTSMTFPDATTIVMKLAFPHGAITKLFGTIYYFAVLPVEAESKFDPRQDMRGSAAWMLTSYERSQGWQYRRNPNWFQQPDRPFLEGIDFALLPEPVQQLAQFKAKRVWASDLTITTPNPFPVPDLVLTAKRESPEALMRSLTPFRGNANYHVIGMSKKADSPFEADVRVRHAVSHLIDRVPWLDTFNNVSGFEKEGLPIEVGWHSHVPCSFYGVWLNPQDKEFGPNAKYFEYNPDEAAKLLRAAGKFGMESDFTYHAVGGFGGPQYPKQMEVFAQMLQAGGHFKLNIKVEDYTSVITPNFTFSHGQYNGITAHPFGSWADWDLGMWNAYTPSGGNDVVGHDTPELKEIMVRHRRELDAKKRIEISNEWQRKIPEFMPVVPFPGDTTRFILHWPWLANVGWFDAAGGGVPSNETFIHYWYDKSKDTRA